MRNKTPNTLWKLCRVLDVSTARVAADLGANYLGLHAIRRAPKKRIATFRRIVEVLRREYPTLEPVLVTKIRSARRLGAILARTGIKMIQIHVHLDSTELRALAQEVSKVCGIQPAFIAVVSASEGWASAAVAEFARRDSPVNIILVDSSIVGGSGRLADPEVVRRLITPERRGRMFLAGGIDVQNVREMISQFKPRGVDVQSRLELDVPSRPKDPLLLSQFAVALGRERHQLHAGTMVRPIVSVSLTSMSKRNAEATLERFGESDIDGVHLDESDGSVAPGFISDCTWIAEQLRSVRPCIPYEVHCFLKDSNRIRQAIKRYLDVNPMLRIVYYHVEEVGSSLGERIEEVAAVGAECGVGLGIAWHATQFTAPKLRAALMAIAINDVLDVSLVTHSARHRLSIVASRVKPLVLEVARWARRGGRRLHITVDRDISIAKLRALQEGAITHAVVGLELLRRRQPQRTISALRELLRPPTRR